MKKILLLTISALLLTGCGKSGAQLDSADEKDARVRKGLELVQQNDLSGAVKQFESALAKNPELGRPDLELAIIYQRQGNDARAIYHYERYLEKRPATEKRELIREWIRQSKTSLAKEVVAPDSGLSNEVARLTRENDMLRRQLDALQKKPAAPAAVSAPVAEKPAEPAKPAVRTYTVRAGDTLSRIAGGMYGDSTLWKKIYEANRQQMKNESDIKVGQTLVIPNL